MHDNKTKAVQVRGRLAGAIVVGTGLLLAPMALMAANSVSLAKERAENVTSRAGESGEWRISGGADYSSGDYGASQDTDILYVPFSAAYLSGPWKAKLTVPWIRIEGPGGVVGGGEGAVVVKPVSASGPRTTESGLGDIWASLAYQVEALPKAYGYLDLTGKVKFPTADEKKGLGTGETDYTVQADYAYALGKLTPMLEVAYKIKGDPRHVDLKNVFYVSAGADYRFDSDVHAGASFDFQQASSAGAEASRELFGYLSFRLSKSWSLMPYAYLGFSKGSPDQGGGLSFGYRL